MQMGFVGLSQRRYGVLFGLRLGVNEALLTCLEQVIKPILFWRHSRWARWACPTIRLAIWITRKRRNDDLFRNINSWSLRLGRKWCLNVANWYLFWSVVLSFKVRADRLNFDGRREALFWYQFFLLKKKTFNRYDVAAACCMSIGLIFFTLADSKVQPNFNSYGTICCLNNILWESHRNCSVLRCADHLSGSCCWCCHWQLSGENHENASCSERGNSKAKQTSTRIINSLAILLGILQFYIRIFNVIVWPCGVQ